MAKHALQLHTKFKMANFRLGLGHGTIIARIDILHEPTKFCISR